VLLLLALLVTCEYVSLLLMKKLLCPWLELYTQALAAQLMCAHGTQPLQPLPVGLLLITWLLVRTTSCCVIVTEVPADCRHSGGLHGSWVQHSFPKPAHEAACSVIAACA
jgi:hypothetical protein